MFLGPYSNQFVGNSVARRGSTAIATVRQASTQAPRIVSSTQKTSKYLNLDNRISSIPLKCALYVAGSHTCNVFV